MRLLVVDVAIYSCLAILIMRGQVGSVNRNWISFLTDCSVGQEIAQDETNGVATFVVKFKDGGFISATCTSNSAPGSN